MSTATMSACSRGVMSVPKARLRVPSEIPELANAIYNGLARGDVKEARFEYFNVLRGDAVCGFVRRFYKEHMHKRLSKRESVIVARALVKHGVFVVVDSHRMGRPLGFADDHSCLVRFRPSSVVGCTSGRSGCARRRAVEQ